MISIDSFDGENRFLSNFAPSKIKLGLFEWETAEHLFQALKTKDMAEREAIRLADTPGKAKRLGRKCTLRNNWEQIKIPVMTGIVAKKFEIPRLQILLIKTYPKVLIEGNNWGDKFWGVCNGSGENNLGKILMWVRRFVMETGGHGLEKLFKL